MKNTDKIYSAEELKLFKEIESGKHKSLPKKEFEKEKIRFQKIAAKTLLLKNM